MDVYPLKFKPIFKERIWGGRKLEQVFGKKLPPQVNIGESWELADLPDDKSEVINGPLAGQTIDKIIEDFGSAITGRDDYKPPFGLLIKILDARDDLSVQVHPDRETCTRTGKGDPKTECWYIIAAEPGAAIYKGLKPGTTREQFAAAINAGTTADMLQKIPVEVGQCHFLPAGTCHAIGAGLLIAEIQTPSDTTYRVFDWNRLDADGKGRQLHVADAMESIHFDQPPEELTVFSEGKLVDSDVFTVDKGFHRARQEYSCEASSMEVLIIIGGSGVIEGAPSGPVTFSAGDTMLIPAAFTGKISAVSKKQRQRSRGRSAL